VDSGFTSHRIERHVVGAALHFHADEPNRTPLHTKQTRRTSEVRGRMHLNAFGRTEARRGDMRRTFDTRRGTYYGPLCTCASATNKFSIVPVVDFVLGWFATAAPRNVGAAVASATSTMSQHEVHAWEAVAGGEVTRVLILLARVSNMRA
jgi:hypothetical protein